jgi:hypothetical protein
MPVGEMLDVCGDRSRLHASLGKVTHVITCGLTGRRTCGPLTLPRKELGDEGIVQTPERRASVPQEGELFLGLGLGLAEILGRAQDALACPSGVPTPTLVAGGLPKAAGEPAESDNLMAHG